MEEQDDYNYIDMPPNKDCVNPGICSESPKIAYETLNLSFMSTVYEGLNTDTIYEYPVN